MLFLMGDSDSIPVRALTALHGHPIENARALGVSITDHTASVTIHGRVFVRPIAYIVAIRRLLGACLRGYRRRRDLAGRRPADDILHLAKERWASRGSFLLLFLAIRAFPAAGALSL